MSFVLYLTLIETAFGMAIVQCFIPRSALGPGFGKTISATIFFCLLFPLLGLKKLMPWMTPGDVAALRIAGGASLAMWFAYFVALNYPKERLLFFIAVWGTLAQATMLWGNAWILARHFYSPGGGTGYGPSMQGLILALSLGTAASSCLLGTVTMAMLIGHWYLVIPGLSIKWLKGGCAAFGVALAFKTVTIAISLTIGAMSDFFGAQGFLDRYILGNLTLFCLRDLVGIFLPACLAWMAYQAAAIKSTQSSTGILFPAMIIVYLGEMIGTYLIVGLSGLPV